MPHTSVQLLSNDLEQQEQPGRRKSGRLRLVELLHPTPPRASDAADEREAPFQMHDPLGILGVISSV